MRYKAYVMQMKMSIHHALLRLIQHDPDTVSMVVEGLLELDLDKYGISVESIYKQAVNEVYLGYYESAIARLGECTTGSYTIVAAMEGYMEILQQIKEEE